MPLKNTEVYGITAFELYQNNSNAAINTPSLGMKHNAVISQSPGCAVCDLSCCDLHNIWEIMYRPNLSINFCRVLIGRASSSSATLATSYSG